MKVRLNEKWHGYMTGSELYLCTQTATNFKVKLYFQDFHLVNGTLHLTLSDVKFNVDLSVDVFL